MAKSVYGRVRGKQVQRAMRSASRKQLAGHIMTGVGGGLLATFPFVGVPLVGAGGATLYSGLQESAKASRSAMRMAVVSRLIGSAKAAKGAAASIARARGVIASTAAARSMAASRKVVPRPAGQRIRNNDSKRSDGQTEGYYRNQGGKRVYVQGYATPAGRSR